MFVTYGYLQGEIVLDIYMFRVIFANKKPEVPCNQEPPVEFV
jgi:hypothetical protein